MTFVGAIAPFVADALVIFGVLVMTIGVYGMIRLPDTYTRLHATSKAVVLGVISLLVASLITGDPEVILRVVLIAGFLVLTTPVSAHVIARAAYARDESMRSPDAVDESDKDLISNRRS